MTSNNEIKSVLTGTIISFVITLILIFGIATLLVATNVSENIITPAIYIITCIGVFVGPMSTVRKSGFLYGGIIGLIYILTLYIISSILNGDFGLTIQSIILIVLSIAFGMLGGIVGVNLRKR